MTAEDIIDGLLAREGGWRDQVTRPDGSIDPATNLGITLDTLRRYALHVGIPITGPIDEAELRRLTPQQAARIYQLGYIEQPGFTPENIPFEPLRVQLIDFGVNSGPERATRWLQRVLQVDATGQLDDDTRHRLRALLDADVAGSMDLMGTLINDALVAARSYMIDRLEDTGALRTADEEGVESRALSFFRARP